MARPTAADFRRVDGGIHGSSQGRGRGPPLPRLPVLRLLGLLHVVLNNDGELRGALLSCCVRQVASMGVVVVGGRGSEERGGLTTQPDTSALSGER